ncbi:MAG: hypothetical protein ACYCO3_10215, partial [Mycobacteriales bacterium]
MQVRGKALALASAAALALGGLAGFSASASATGTTTNPLSLDPGTSSLATPITAQGYSSSAGLLYATGGENTRSPQQVPATESLLSGSGSTTTLPSSMDQQYPEAFLVGSFATALGYSSAGVATVNFDNTATAGDTGSDTIASGTQFLTGGPGGWLTSTQGSTISYVQPSGTGLNATTTSTTIATLPPGDSALSAQANATDVVIGYENYTNNSSGVESVPLAGGSAVTLASYGDSWSAVQSVDGSNEIDSISCASNTFCMAVDSSGQALSFNGSSWSSPVPVTSASGTSGPALTSVSCPTTSMCVAVDAAGGSWFWSGSSWTTTRASVGPGNTRVSAVSCPSASVCAALVGADVFEWSSTNGWSSSPVYQDPATNPTLNSISCSSTTSCMAVDSSGNVVSGSPSSTTAWTATDIDSTTSLSSISCPTSGSLCVATDTTGHALTWNGSTWSSPVLMPTQFGSPPPLAGVSCAPSGAVCVAVGNDSVFTSTDPTGDSTSSWYQVSGVDYSGLASVSCASSSLCVAGDFS